MSKYAYNDYKTRLHRMKDAAIGPANVIAKTEAGADHLHLIEV